MGTLVGVEKFLDFTMETIDDFNDKWLPTLDTKLKVDRSNQVLFDFYEKPTSSNLTVQKRTAMGEDAKIQVVSNDLIRRLQNCSEELGMGAKVKIVDEYTQKLSNSGYRGEHLKKIITNGIKGYEGKVRRCREQGRGIHRTSVDSEGARVRKKLLGKSSWFKKSRRRGEQGDLRDGDQQKRMGGGMTDKWGSKYARELEVKTVLFVEQTPGGELAKRMRETLRGMEHTLGFRVKVAERTGQNLGSKFPLNNLWDGMKCGRTDCITCEQGLEELPPCTRVNLLYENICTRCNPGATRKGELMETRNDIPTVYVGESSRSIYERSREHWEGARKGASNNHMVKHQVGEHDNQAPQFAMKVVKHFRSALARQVAEAVRIRRRGGREPS